MLSIESHQGNIFTNVDNMIKNISISENDKLHIKSIAEKINSMYIVNEVSEVYISLSINNLLDGSTFRVLISNFGINKYTKDLYAYIGCILDDDTGNKIYENDGINFLVINLSKPDNIVNNISIYDSKYYNIKIDNKLSKCSNPLGIWCDFYLSNK